nr:hypothetical protein [Tanacetum cinerariifolium]
PGFSGRIVPLFDYMPIPQGEGSGKPTEPHHTPSPEAQQTSPTTTSSPSLPHVSTASIPTVTLTDTPQLRHYTRRARIAQSSALLPVADEPASLIGDVSQGEACPTISGLEAEQDRANIIKISTFPSDSTPRTELVSKFEAQELEITRLKARIKLLEDKDGGVAEPSGEDAPIKGRRLDEGEEAAKRVSDDTEEMTTVLTFMDAASSLTSRGVHVVPTATEVATATVSIPTGSEVFPIVSPTIPTAAQIFTTATESTPYTKRKGKEKMVESDTPSKKKLHERIDVQVARELEEEMAREAQRLNEQIHDFIPIGSKEEAERFKRKGIRFEQESVKKLKTSEDVKETEEVLKEKVKEMIQLVPVEEVYVEALQVKHPIVDWKVYTEGQRSYWKIIRMGGSSASYQFFVDILKHVDREDLNQL